MGDNRLSVCIVTCNKNFDLWQNNKVLFERYWSDHPDIFVVTDEDNIKGSKLFKNFLHVNSNFSYRLLHALNGINSKYVLVTLDDYLLCEHISNNYISKLLYLMDRYNLTYLRLFNRAKINKWLDKKNKLKRLTLKKEAYEVNLYPSIWRKDDLIKLIKQDENPWKFEVRLNRRCRELNYNCAWVDDKNVYPFIDTIRKAKYLRRAYRFLKRKKLYINDSRSIRTIRETISLYFRTIISRYSPTFVKRILKKIMKADYFSNYADGDE